MLRFVRLPVVTSVTFFLLLPLFSSIGIAQEYPGCFMVTSSGQVISLKHICTSEKKVSQDNQSNGIVTATASDNPISKTVMLNSLVQQGLEKHGIGDYEGAIEDYTNALRTNPNDAVAYYYRAAVRSQLKDYKAASADLQQAAKLSSNQGLTPIYQQAQKLLDRIKQLQQFYY